jgi:inhibitor of growth protein 3
MPSLLRDSPGNMVPPSSLSNTGTSTPLHPVSGNQGGGAPNLAQAAAIARLTNATNVTLNARLNPSLQNMQTQALLNQQRLTNAQSAIQANARQEREMSAGSDSKRRRPTGSIGPLPSASSPLSLQRQVHARAALDPGRRRTRSRSRRRNHSNRCARPPSLPSLG